MRYADDFVVGFELEPDARRFQAALAERLGRFGLELHAQKTRLIRFGRHAAEQRRRRGERKPETFDYLGFTHICGKTRRGKFIVLRRPVARRMRAKLRQIKQELRRRMHQPIKDVGRWLCSVVNGWYRYYAVPLTSRILASFRRRVSRLWQRVLSRRSQKGHVPWQRMYCLIDRWLPRPRILQPYPWERLRVTTRGRSPVR